jgi:uncharacterized damage-inducible protein DinB
MSRIAIEQMLYLLDEAFERHVEHGLLRNLRSVNDDDWHWKPEGGGRSIFDIVQHTGECKYMYGSHAFADGSMRFDRPGSTPTISSDETPAEIVAWLKKGQQLLLGQVAELTEDDELLKPRKANWGQEYETRWLINVIIQHELYHGGEINHIRSLKQGTDRWAWEKAP